jgi:purine/pyrimidine-nucleoside phosphorylase
MLKHNTYFDGGVQSLGFERHGRAQTVGVIAPGTYTFTTGSAERMTVVNGELHARTGQGAWTAYPAGTAFEIPAKTAFEVKASAPSAYWCEFL